MGYDITVTGYTIIATGYEITAMGYAIAALGYDITPMAYIITAMGCIINATGYESAIESSVAHDARTSPRLHRRLREVVRGIPGIPICASDYVSGAGLAKPPPHLSPLM
jgi:hypothetical protein